MLNSNGLRNLKIAATTSKHDYDTASNVERGRQGVRFSETSANAVESLCQNVNFIKLIRVFLL
jgi:hypothetical protein